MATDSGFDMTPSGDIGPSTDAGSGAPESGQAPGISSAPSSPNTVGIPPTAGAEAAAKMVEKTAAELGEVFAPSGDVKIDDAPRDESGRFVSPNATRPGADYAKAAPDNSKAANTEPGKAAGNDTPPSWRTSFAQNFGVPDDAVDEAAKMVADDFGRVMSDFESGRAPTRPQTPAGAAANPAAPPTGQPQQAAPQAPATPAGLEKYSDAEIAAYTDNFDADTAAVMTSQAKRHNALVDALAAQGTNATQAKQAVEQARAEAQMQAQAQYDAEHINPFFKAIGGEFPELAAIYGGDKASRPQLAARQALRDSAQIYFDWRAQAGKPVTPAQALQAASQHFHAEVYAAKQQTEQRRDDNTIRRHRNRDISAGPASGGHRASNPDTNRIAMAQSFLNGHHARAR